MVRVVVESLKTAAVETVIDETGVRPSLDLVPVGRFSLSALVSRERRPEPMPRTAECGLPVVITFSCDARKRGGA